MGVRITIGDYDYDATDYTVSEEASPVALGDSMGSVGTITFTTPMPDPVMQPNHPINLYTEGWLKNQAIRLADSRYGFTIGTVDSSSVTANGTLLQVESQTRLGDLNIYNVQAEPFIGTLGDAFEYYLSLAGITTDLFVDESIASRAVAIPGWEGELWFHLKELTAAQDCDISLVSGVVLLRPIRTRVAERGKDIQRSTDNRTESLAQAVEVYLYKTEAIEDELVYPIGGWTPETEVLNVNAGETAEYTLELSSSLSSIQAPTMLTSVAQDYDATSVYTIVADDGLPVPVDQWEDFGGKVEITLNPDTTTLNVKLTGAEGVPTTGSGETSRAFSLALASDTSGSRYSTLRIVGTGVRYERILKRVRTGVSAQNAPQDVGVTIDNIFINTIDDLYRAGTRAAKRFAGNMPSISGSLYSINRRGDTGVASYPTYGEVQDALTAEIEPGSPGLVLPGDPGDFAWAPDSAALDITGDISVRVEADLGDWSELGYSYLAGKSDIPSDQRSWDFLTVDGLLVFRWATDGTIGTRTSSLSTGTVPLSGRFAVRADLDVDNGSGGSTTTFYTAPGIDGPWTQLGDPVVESGTTSIFSGSARLTAGAGDDDGSVLVTEGVVCGVDVLDGATAVANPRFEDEPDGTTSFTDGEGNEWTVAGNAEIRGTPTYGDVQTHYGAVSYGTVRADWFETVQSEYKNQAFGNVQGARIWDRRTRRWYRIRSGSISPTGIQFSLADDDLLYSDVVNYLGGLTYAQVQATRSELTYGQEKMVGLYGA